MGRPDEIDALDAHFPAGREIDEALADQDIARVFESFHQEPDRVLLRHIGGDVAIILLDPDRRVIGTDEVRGDAATTLIRDFAYRFAPLRRKQLRERLFKGSPVEDRLKSLFGRVRRPLLDCLWIELHDDGSQKRAYRPRGEGVLLIELNAKGDSEKVELIEGADAMALEAAAKAETDWDLPPARPGGPLKVQNWGEALMVVRIGLARPIRAREKEGFSPPRLEILGESSRGIERYVFVLEERDSPDPTNLGRKRSEVLDAADLLLFVSRYEAARLGGQDAALQPVALAAARAALARCPAGGGPIPAEDFRGSIGRIMAEREPQRFSRAGIQPVISRLLG